MNRWSVDYELGEIGISLGFILILELLQCLLYWEIFVGHAAGFSLQMVGVWLEILYMLIHTNVVFDNVILFPVICATYTITPYLTCQPSWISGKYYQSTFTSSVYNFINLL